MFTIEMLPAQRGDSLWITYGEGDDRHHVLVDGGPQETIRTLVPELERRIRALPGRTNRLELLVVTHVDADHIQGIVSLLSDHTRVAQFRDVWFNGYEHLGGDLLGGLDGERLTAALSSHPRRWNAAFQHGPVAVPPEGPLPTCSLPGGLKLTLLGPRPEALARLAPQWEKTCLKAGIIAGHGAEIARRSWMRDDLLGFDIDALASLRYRRDTSTPNSTSITFIADYRGTRVLLLGDASAEEVVAGLDRLGAGPHRFAAVKSSHHGSKRNTSPALLERIRAKYWLVSTNGARFGHPDAEGLARVVTSQKKPVFVLNYGGDHVADLIASVGNRYKVRHPRTYKDGHCAEGFVLRLS